MKTLWLDVFYWLIQIQDGVQHLIAGNLFIFFFVSRRQFFFKEKLIFFCSYAVIASGCASCPRIKCERPGCDINFCYHCKAEWHPDQTCDAARASRHSPIRAPSGSISQDSQHRDDIKPCPRCQVLIVKMDDGSCNHMVCAVCGSEFCWLCMKVISDLHYLRYI